MNTSDGGTKDAKRDDLTSSLGIVKRAVEKTADRLSRSTALASKSPPSPLSSSTLGQHRRLFSLSRKNRMERNESDGDQSTCIESESGMSSKRNNS